VAVIGSTLTYGGSSGPDVLDVGRAGKFFYLTQGAGRLAVGRRCVRIDRRTAKCSAAGVRSFYASGGSGDDSIANSTSLPSTLRGGAGDDSLEGGSAGDLIDGQSGDDSLDGNAGRDTLLGSGTDMLGGGPDADELRGGGILDGGPGNDTLIGDASDNTLLGGEGDDYLDGAAGADRLLAGAGADIALGGDGNDAISGEAPDEATIPIDCEGQPDLIYCQAGTDNFLYADNQIDVSCENEGFVLGIGGGYSAVVVPRLHRPERIAPWLEIRVKSRAEVDFFKVRLTFLDKEHAKIGETIDKVRGKHWVRVRERVPGATRFVKANVVT
jgi:hypothetical protein